VNTVGVLARIQEPLRLLEIGPGLQQLRIDPGILSSCRCGVAQDDNGYHLQRRLHDVPLC
jgi:hypothetical protein